MKSCFGHEISGIRDFGGPVREAFRRRLLDLETVYNCATEKRLRANLWRDIFNYQYKAHYNVELMETAETHPIRIYRRKTIMLNQPFCLIATAPDMATAELIKKTDGEYERFYEPE